MNRSCSEVFVSAGESPRCGARIPGFPEFGVRIGGTQTDKGAQPGRYVTVSGKVPSQTVTSRYVGRSEKLGAGYEFPGPGGLRESVVARTRTEARKGFRAGFAAGWVHRGTAG